VDQLLVALDLDTAEEAARMAGRLRGAVGGFKVNVHLFTAEGPSLVRDLVQQGDRVFLDLKFHDIPNTVAGAVRSAGRLGVAMLTVHAAGGRAMLRAAVEAAGEAERSLWVLGVTVLTSLDDEDLRATGIREDAETQVLRLAELALEVGCQGIVCSPLEIEPLRERFGREPRLVVPGIRPASEIQDQKRTLAPGRAIGKGADLLVIGRPITGAPDPRAAALAIDADIRRARAA